MAGDREKITISAKDVGKLTLGKPTRLERLMALCIKVHPTYGTFDQGKCCNGSHGAIYTIEEPEPETWRVRITDPISKDSMSGVGPTKDAALDALEAKLK